VEQTYLHITIYTISKN